MGEGEEAPEEHRRNYKRVSNAHTSHPSNRSKAQDKRAQYGKKNAANYEDEEKKAVGRKKKKRGRG